MQHLTFRGQCNPGSTDHNCFSTMGLSFTTVSFLGGQREAQLRLRAILFSRATLFILFISHLHIHYQLRKTPPPKPPLKPTAISLLLGESLDPSASLMKTWGKQNHSSSSTGDIQPQNKAGTMWPFLAYDREAAATMVKPACSEQTVPSSSARKYLSCSLQPQCHHVAAVQAP